jgi:oligosaccharide repeat unit polymerase
VIEQDTYQMTPSSLDQNHGSIKNWIGQIALFVFTVILFIFCPKGISMPYIYVCFGDFMVSTYLYFVYKNKSNYLDFDTLFVLLYTILGFAYPVFMYDADNPFSIAFSLSFNVNFIPLGVVCFVLGIQSYYLGSMITKKTSSLKKIDISGLRPINNTLLSIIVIILSISFILSGGIQYYQSVYKYGDALTSTGLLFQIMALMHAFSVTAIAIEFYNKCVDHTYKLNKLLLVSISCIIVLMLYAGNRTLASQLALPILGLYTMFFQKIGKFKILIFLILGIVFMWIIQNNRSGSEITSDVSGVENIISDLTIPTRSTFSSMEYVDEFGHTYGMNMLGGIIATVPSLERVLLLFGIKHNSLSSAEFLTEYTLGSDTKLGLGTNVIADIYLSFGVLGIIILMFFLGWFVNKQLYNAKNMHFYSIIVYSCFMSYAVFLVRSTYTHPIKLIIWCLIIGVINKSLSQKLFSRSE